MGGAPSRSGWQAERMTSEASRPDANSTNATMRPLALVITSASARACARTQARCRRRPRGPCARRHIKAASASVQGAHAHSVSPSPIPRTRPKRSKCSQSSSLRRSLYTSGTRSSRKRLIRRPSAPSRPPSRHPLTLGGHTCRLSPCWHTRLSCNPRIVEQSATDRRRTSGG